MDERITVFVQTLKKQLEGLPEEEIREALSYYGEYLNDALYAGKDQDEILLEIGALSKF